MEIKQSILLMGRGSVDLSDSIGYNITNASCEPDRVSSDRVYFQFYYHNKTSIEVSVDKVNSAYLQKMINNYYLNRNKLFRRIRNA